jgi:hypothetical protein
MGYTKISLTPVVTRLYTLVLPIIIFAIGGGSRFRDGRDYGRRSGVLRRWGTVRNMLLLQGMGVVTVVAVLGGSDRGSGDRGTNLQRAVRRGEVSPVTVENMNRSPSRAV